MKKYTLLCFLVLQNWLLILNANAQQFTLAKPLEQGHSHNDYWRPHPLTDALQLGFKSVEADVFLKDGKLLVGHDQKELQPTKTLQSLYLEPLRRQLQTNKHVYTQPGILLLYIDFKTEGEALYTALAPVLEKYKQLLVNPQKERKGGAVKVILTGNYPRDRVAADKNRLVYLDGQVQDMAQFSSASLYPTLNGNWTNFFTWNGEGPIPAAEAQRLKEWNAQALKTGQKIRFWNMPEANEANIKNVWRELLQYESILIGTDHLDWLKQALPQP